MKIINLKSAFMALSVSLMTTAAIGQEIPVPAPSPLQTMTQKFGLGEVSVEYSRPAAKGRTIFGNIVPYDKIWRTAANGTTKITFTDDVTFQGKAVKAGTYGLYTIPRADSWDIMLYSDLKLGGSVTKYDEKNEVVRVTVKALKLPFKLESFTITLDNVLPTSADLLIVWDNTAVKVELKTDIDERIMESIEKSMKSKKPEYFKAATYYFENNKDLKKALPWIQKAAEESPHAYWVMLMKAKIEYGVGDKTAGKASAEKTIELADKMGDANYVRLANELMDSNK